MLTGKFVSRPHLSCSARILLKSISDIGSFDGRNRNSQINISLTITRFILVIDCLVWSDAKNVNLDEDLD
jgi:hypothetical protein